MDTPENETDVSPFAALGLCDRLLEALERSQFVTPTAIQAAAIPILLEGRDAIGLARTGTGKTAAFGLPLLQRLDPERREVQALVLAPTRELAVQVSKALQDFAGRTGIATVYGGQPMGRQIREIERGAQVVVGTPGRVLDLLKRGALRFNGLDCAVLDEADEMLQMGFIEDIEAIFGFAPKDRPRQTMLFSATMSRGVRAVAAKHLKDPVDVSVAGDEEAVPEIDQQLLIVRVAEKVDALDRLLEVESQGAALVFTQTRVAAAELAERLEGRGHSAAALHGDMSQALREAVLARFRRGRARVLVATDVAARGLDVDIITLVVNFDPPDGRDAYVHRIGRTGRAGRRGTAVTFAGPRDKQFIMGVQRYAGSGLTRRSPPTLFEVMQSRAARLRRELENASREGLDPYLAEVDALVEAGMDPREVAAIAAKLMCGDRGLVSPDDLEPAPTMVPFWIPVGRKHGVYPNDIIGALCRGLGLPREGVGAVDLSDRHGEVWIDETYAEAILRAGSINVRGRPTRIERADGLGRQRRGPAGGNPYRGNDRFGGPRGNKGPGRKGGAKRHWKKRP